VRQVGQLPRIKTGSVRIT